MRLIDADKITYSWTIDRDGQQHDGVTLQSIINKMPTIKPEPCEDAVSRQAAIDAALSAFSRGLLASPDIRRLPSVTPKLPECEDAVSRQDVVDMLQMYPFVEYGEYAEAREVVKRLPPVTPQQKTGEWIIDGHHMRCNQCGVYFCNTDREGDMFPKRFCPNCGAKMEM